MQRFFTISAAALIATLSGACTEFAVEPASVAVRSASNLLNGQCSPTEPDIFRPECTAEWNPNDTLHTSALNAAFNAARTYQDQNGGVASHVLLEGREYRFEGTLNGGDSSEKYNPPGITVRNENFQQGPTRLVTDDPSGQVVIQGGDIFQYLIIQGPHRNTGPRHSVGWSGDTYPTCGGPTGPAGVNGSVRHGWSFFMSTVEGFINQGILLAGATDATVSHATIQDNGGVGIQLTTSTTAQRSVNNTIQYTVSRYNGLNGIDINADSTYVYKSNASYNGWNYPGCLFDRNGILIWGVPGQASSSHNIVDDNDAFENELHGIWVGASDSYTSSVAGNVVTGNRAFHNDSSGIVVMAGEGATNSGTFVENNTIYGNGRWGLSVYERNGGHVQSAIATGNTITSNGSCAYWGTGTQLFHSWNSCNGSVMDPAYLNVSITGPTSILTSGTYQWTANVSGGAGTYTYQWYMQTDHWWPRGSSTCHYQTGWVPIGTGQAYSTYVSADEYDFRLRVDVVSGNENDTHSILVYGDGTQPCPS